jgi:uncharacterized phiE125 gp8 family phage protein
MSILTVTTPAASSLLASLADLKSELGISGSTQDTYLTDLLTQSSQTIETYLNRRIVSEVVSELFRDGELPTADRLMLGRFPVTALASVTVDGVALSNTLYERDDRQGFVYRLDASGNRDYWQQGGVRKIVVAYTAGYTTVPADIERACLEVAKGKYYAQLRDPSLKKETIPGVIEQEFWVGTVGTERGGIPSQVASSIDSYRVMSYG